MSGWRKRQIMEIRANLDNEKRFWKETFKTYGIEGSFFRKKIAEFLGLTENKESKKVCQQNTEKLK